MSIKDVNPLQPPQWLARYEEEAPSARNDVHFHPFKPSGVVSFTYSSVDLCQPVGVEQAKNKGFALLEELSCVFHLTHDSWEGHD